MSNSLRVGFAISGLAIAAVLAGCAAPTSKMGFGGKIADADLGLATRAQAALAAGDLATAVGLAERAVERTPDDAGFRTLLGNAYFAAGRFASAEAAYRDSLSLLSNQPQVVLKLALVLIGQGRNGEGRQFLDAARAVLDPSDYGLAVALAGSPAEAAGVLEAAAREPGADARVRQNLALAYALSGEWTAARTVAAQDLSADIVEQRVEQWMRLARPQRPSDQLAALIGVSPAASDPGQPIRLALNMGNIRHAAIEAPAPVLAEQAPATAPVAAEPLPVLVEAAPAPAAIVTDAAPQPVALAAAEPEPAFVPPPPPRGRAARKPSPVVRAASFLPKAPLHRAALKAPGKSTAVVQLGAYGSPQRVAAAWNQAAARMAALRAYTPMSARFDGPRGTVYRLSVKGFGSLREAASLCAAVRRSGGSCFVRSFAGDSPVRIASR